MIKINKGKTKIEGQYNVVLAEFSLLAYKLMNNAGVSKDELYKRINNAETQIRTEILKGEENE